MYSSDKHVLLEQYFLIYPYAYGRTKVMHFYRLHNTKYYFFSTFSLLLATKKRAAHERKISRS